VAGWSWRRACSARASLVEAPEAPSAQVVRAGEGVPLWRGRAGGLAKLMAGVGTRHQVEP
jgi:hypothetical protein